MPKKLWSMYPKLHDQVSALLESDDLFFDFHRADDDRNSIREHDSTIMGRFRCHNPGCETKGWSSKKIAITIRMYDGDKYNARVYHQRCESCKWASRPWLDGSYAVRIVYRLKNWLGIEQERPPHSMEGEPTHLRHLCEGCKAGHCKAGYGD